MVFDIFKLTLERRTNMQINFSENVNNNLVNDNNFEKVGLIYRTTNYQDFVLNSINRKINNARVKHFVNEYKDRQIISPIEVMRDDNTGKLVILDGQHRFRAWMKLGLPIYFFETISGDDSTQGLRQRNQGKAWSTLDTVNSFASDDRKPAQAKQYRDLQEIIMYTQDALGRVPLIPLIELASGINRDLDQRIIYAHHDFKNGLYTTYDRDNFIDVIDQIHIMQTKLHGDVTMTASMFRGLFTILSIKDANASYLAQCINQDRSAFEVIAANNDDQDAIKSLLNLYNAKAVLNGQKPLAYAVGIDGIKINSDVSDVTLANEK